MKTRLPGQTINTSPELQKLLERARTECQKKIKFAAILPEEGFEGRFDWRKTYVLIEMNPDLTPTMAEYVAAHELCHVLQLARGCAIASGRKDEPGAVTIATLITDFVLDPLADSMADDYGIPMASGFKAWFESKSLLDSLKQAKNGRRYGTNWRRIWEGLMEVRVCRRLAIESPRPTKDFWTLYLALSLGGVALRATNLGLNIGVEILESIKKLRILSKVVTDLTGIGATRNVQESVSKLIAILDYFETPPGHIFINKPFTGEFLIEGQWQTRPKEKPLEEEL